MSGLEWAALVAIAWLAILVFAVAVCSANTRSQRDH